jgi:hypothetical protein
MRVDFMAYRAFFFVATFVALIAISSAGYTHDGEDHGHSATPAPKSLIPSLEGTGELFELAGLVERNQLRLWIDHVADTSPVLDATVEITGPDGKTLKATLDKDGVYATPVSWPLAGGNLELTIAVITPAASDLIVAPLVVPQEVHDHGVTGWYSTVALLVSGAAIGALFLPVVRRLQLTLVAILILGLLVGPKAQAHNVEDHGDEAPRMTAVANAPMRLPDGQLFAPKSLQRLINIKTAEPNAVAMPTSVIVAGRVIADPAFSARVQGTESGRYQAPVAGLPLIGTHVTKGQIVGYIVPAVGTLSRGDIQERQASLARQIALAQARVKRLDALANITPKRDVEDARAELLGLERQREALDPTLGRREILTAPLSGIIAESTAVEGLVVDDRTQIVLFTIVNPEHVLIDVRLPVAELGDIRTASLVLPDQPIQSLIPVSTAPMARGGYAQLLLKPVSDSPSKLPKIGTTPSITLVTNVESIGDGLSLPRAALVRGKEGLPIVIEQIGPQSFQPRIVRIDPGDGPEIVVRAGIEHHARIVISGAALLNQIR